MPDDLDSVVPPTVATPVVSVADQECELCEFAMTVIYNVLGDRRNEEAVKEALDNLCNKMPQSVNAQCVKFVDEYSEQVIDYITHNLPPEQVTEAINGVLQHKFLA